MCPNNSVEEGEQCNILLHLEDRLRLWLFVAITDAQRAGAALAGRLMEPELADPLSHFRYLLQPADCFPW